MTAEPRRGRRRATASRPASVDTVEAAGAAVDQLTGQVRAEFVPDARWGVFDVGMQHRDGVAVLVGETTAGHAVGVLLQRLAAAGIAVEDGVTRLPDAGLGADAHAVVRAALAPLYAEPLLPAPQISQLILGMRVELLSRRADWLRIRGEDGYVGWVHAGYLRTGTEDWAKAWERGVAGEPVVSLGADLLDEDGRILARLPWGARLVRHTGAYQLPDGRRAGVVSGEIVDVDRLADRFPARGESIARTARRWLGAPYVWGGVTQHGVDCSGFTQAVMWMHGIALPRDSDLQAVTGVGAEVDADPHALRAGDLLFFAQPAGRIDHVAISLGGTHIIHAAITNGVVQVNDLGGDSPLESRLAAMLSCARRLLAD